MGLITICEKPRTVYASLKESFGLSVAEAMNFGLPVLVLDNLAHRNLVNNDENLLFENNNIQNSITKLDNIISHYERYVDLTMKYSKLLQNRFMNEWQNLLYSDSK